MLSFDQAEIVGDLVSLVLTRLRPVARKPKVKVAGNSHPRVASTLRNLRDNIRESDARRVHKLLRRPSIEIQPRVTHSEFVQHVHVEGVLPCGRELLRVGSALIAESWQGRSGKGYIVERVLIVCVSIKPERVF